jgi:hypothetical protein
MFAREPEACRASRLRGVKKVEESRATILFYLIGKKRLNLLQ